ncbi:hypothetical protein LLG96_15395 [bacterium]|nr:hypothetical protein [bacterium]
MKNKNLFFLWIVVSLPLLTMCESGNDKNITGNYINRKPGKLESTTAQFDSLYTYAVSIGDATYLFAGRYGKASAFATVKFPQPTSSLLDSLEKATLKMNVGSVWKDGTAAFALYETISDWSDSVRLDRDKFLSGLQSPVSIFADTASSIGSLDFELPPEVINSIRTWNLNGSFLVTSTGDGNTMVNLTSWNSSYKPYIEFLVRKAGGAIDTTKTSCILTNYGFDTGFDPGSSNRMNIVSDADARAFVFKYSLPESLSPAMVINGCTARINIIDTLIPTSDGMKIGFYLLTAQVGLFTSATYDSESSIEETITEGQTYLDIDISSFMNAWHKTGASNYGILVKPLTTSTYLNQVILAPEDSVTISYTTYPEVE